MVKEIHVRLKRQVSNLFETITLIHVVRGFDKTEEIVLQSGKIKVASSFHPN